MYSSHVTYGGNLDENFRWWWSFMFDQQKETKTKSTRKQQKKKLKTTCKHIYNEHWGPGIECWAKIGMILGSNPCYVYWLTDPLISILLAIYVTNLGLVRALPDLSDSVVDRRLLPSAFKSMWYCVWMSFLLSLRYINLRTYMTHLCIRVHRKDRKNTSYLIKDWQKNNNNNNVDLADSHN